ncbi:dihydropteroate synthase [Modestobacter sp. DSM 44400]|uniref:dihydropteroate synthase n=1 Tax=Modestobacter sp. DSM 44400 TaxID=1550230 RepID=UPI0020C88D81|nr:dihydropteroate synthase [Modestobacter sp. DSM 44400]
MADLVLRLGSLDVPDGGLVVMAIVNRTPDSFYDRGATYELDAAVARVGQVVAEGADMVDVGGVKAAPGEDVSPAEEVRRTVDLVAAIRAAHPQLPISIDTWRAEVAREALTAGADVVNDAWGGVDPELATVAAQTGAGIVCTHAGGLPPRTRPHRVSYPDVMADVITRTTALARAAVDAGVDPERVLVDPGHDFGKNTRHSLEATRRLDELVATGWPVLVALSNKDFVGETLDVPLDQRLTGTLAATAVSAWLGARVFRAHDVLATRQTLDMVAAIRGDRPPLRTTRGLA